MTRQLPATRDQKVRKSQSGCSKKACSDCVFVSCWGGSLQQTAERDALDFINSKDVLCAYVLLHAGKVDHCEACLAEHRFPDSAACVTYAMELLIISAEVLVSPSF